MNPFMKYYQEEKEMMEKMIYEYNQSLLTEENSYLRDNLKVFVNLNHSGKRIRGILVNLGYQLKKGRSTYSYPLALAYELFQTSILIHDDIIDQDEKRRGIATVHYYNKEKYKEVSSETEVNHLSNSIALCIGDYGFYLANQKIAEAYQEDKNLGKVLTFFNDTVLKTAKGELLDVILPFESKNIGVELSTLEKTIIDIYRLKTSYYTMIGPISSGMILAGTNKEELDSIDKIGEKIGIAFQIQDDILGIFSNETGKTKASDIKECKQTLLYAYAKNSSYSEELDSVYGTSKLDDTIIQKVQDIMKKSKALEKATNLMNSLYDEAIHDIYQLDWISEEDKDILVGFVDYLRGRNQ